MNEIRRLELAVIAAAQKWRDDVRAGKGIAAEGENIARLRDTIDALTYACPECNAGGHTCPGDGNPIPHGANDCGEHDASTLAGMQIEREAIAEQEKFVADLFVECGKEWLKYADLPQGRQVKIEHHYDDRGDVTRLIADAGRGDVLGDFRVTVAAKRLPPLPPVGPEEDGALRDELATEADQPIWVPRTWADVRSGDDVRLPGTENCAHVSSAVHERWHVDPRTGTSGYNPAQALEWSGVHVVLHTVIPGQGVASQAGEFTMDPAKPIEIKLTPSEVDALNALDAGGLDGWRNRVALTEVTPDITDKDI